MPQPGESLPTQPSAEDSYLEVLAETLESLEEAVRGQFLREFFRTIAQLDLTEAQSNEYWERILLRRRELGESIGRKISLKTAMVDVLASTNFLRVPILMEYEDFKKLQINAATDPLTGLYNRRLFDEYCDKELNRAKRYGHQLAVVILDVHKLKEVNDHHGHLQGDQILQLAAATLRKTLRASDFAFRIGGDEFALLLPQTDSEQAITLCRRVRAQYEGDVHSLNLDPGVTLDFGVAVTPLDGEQKSVLMRVADDRLYELKNAGRSGTSRAPATFQPQRGGPGDEAAQQQDLTSRSSTETFARRRPEEFFPRRRDAAASEAESGPLRENPTAQQRPGRTAQAQPPQLQSVVVPGQPDTSPQGPTSSRPEQRKWERVSLAGTKAYALLTESDKKTATLMDLSYGGVALLVETGVELPNQFSAILHVPILPPVRVILRKSYTQRVGSDRERVGCSFVS
ncbi:MAG TPA: GGDEF domain-containing protein [Candidatus Acidoferrales bacterium]|jgi:diguanylate cyclase (GGDEF)-like protein|nr:GGDEF domain-containing protein [Candidatus Acidoferrales bacterium]